MRLLEEAGFEVVAQAGDAEDLLRKVGAHAPAVAIVDIRMPPTNADDGLRAAIEIRRRWPHVGVLVLSQYVEDTLAMDLVVDSHGGIGYLLKDRVRDVARLTDARDTRGRWMAPERDDEECSNDEECSIIVRDERTRPRQAEHQPESRAAIIFRAAGGRTELAEHPTSLTRAPSGDAPGGVTASARPRADDQRGIAAAREDRPPGRQEARRQQVVGGVQRREGAPGRRPRSRQRP